MIDISIIVPVYNEAQNITVFIKRMSSEVKKITNNYEIIIFDIYKSKFSK